MFARMVEAPAKPGKRNEVMTILKNELAPLLREQKGFVDFVGLGSDTNPLDGITLAFWTSKNDAEKFYGSQEYKTILSSKITPLLEKMTIRTFNVEASTFHKIEAAVQAA